MEIGQRYGMGPMVESGGMPFDDIRHGVQGRIGGPGVGHPRYKPFGGGKFPRRF